MDLPGGRQVRDPYGKAVATRAGPEPWRCGGDAVTQASAGVRVGWVLSGETILGSAADHW